MGFGTTLGRSPAGRASARLKKRDPLIQVAFLQVVPELTIDLGRGFYCEFFRVSNRAGVVRWRANAPHQI